MNAIADTEITVLFLQKLTGRTAKTNRPLSPEQPQLSNQECNAAFPLSSLTMTSFDSTWFSGVLMSAACRWDHHSKAARQVFTFRLSMCKANLPPMGKLF